MREVLMLAALGLAVVVVLKVFFQCLDWTRDDEDGLE